MVGYVLVEFILLFYDLASKSGIKSLGGAVHLIGKLSQRRHIGISRPYHQAILCNGVAVDRGR
ncbi:hypothetical protein SDC9_211500 [bioreactor metagenome]|uniref:Uncharacterized protein n=1 Tax=bioreactor metagenome TaxID=1076179 RepID=A0A645JVK5_9ZZZZ